jgi:hypothetical protein
MSNFQLLGLDPSNFEALFDLDDAQLRRARNPAPVADQSPGFPCRVSLEDAEVGEEVLLLAFEHMAVDSPYRASGPIYVRRARARTAVPPASCRPTFPGA